MLKNVGDQWCKTYSHLLLNNARSKNIPFQALKKDIPVFKIQISVKIPTFSRLNIQNVPNKSTRFAENWAL